jgi:hypothetical protein
VIDRQRPDYLPDQDQRDRRSHTEPRRDEGDGTKIGALSGDEARALRRLITEMYGE